MSVEWRNCSRDVGCNCSRGVCTREGSSIQATRGLSMASQYMCLMQYRSMQLDRSSCQGSPNRETKVKPDH